MSTRAGAVPLSDLQFLKIYFNKRRLRSTPANLRKMLVEAGGDAICNGSIFLSVTHILLIDISLPVTCPPQ